MTSWRTVAFILLPLVPAAAVGLATGRRPSLAAIRALRRPLLLWLAALVHLLRFENPAWLPGWASARDGSVLLLVCWLAGLAWVTGNLAGGRPGRTAALWVTTAGFTANTAVILANAGEMPFSLPAARWAGVPEALIHRPAVGHAPLVGGDALWWLSDLIPVPLLQKVISPGDLLMVIGVTGILVASSPRRPRAAGAAPDRTGSPARRRAATAPGLPPRP